MLSVCLLSFFAESEPEILLAARTLESCLELIIPTPEDFNIPEIEEASAGVPLNSMDLLSSSKMVQKWTDMDDENDSAKHREIGIIDPVAHAVTVTLRPGDYDATV